MIDIDRSRGYVRSKAASSAGLVSGFAFPVLVAREVVAVLEFYSEEPQTPSSQTLKLMAQIGTQLGRVIEREQHARVVRDLSLRDELTGLLNRRGFMELGRHQREVAMRSGRPFAVLFADLNGMKTINDQLGHEVGDCALRDAAELLSSTFRGADLIARLGGDEFVVLAVDADPEHTNALEARVREALGAASTGPERPYELSMSLGVATFDPCQPQSLDELLGVADARMYAQKRAAGAVQAAPSFGRDDAGLSRRLS